MCEKENGAKAYKVVAGFSLPGNAVFNFNRKVRGEDVRCIEMAFKVLTFLRDKNLIVFFF